MSIKEDLTQFLESSTIHGLVYWSTTRRFWKLFWILTVFLGFFIACILIQLSFKGWNESPIKITIETLPITEVVFPKIIVCPPNNTYTNLNLDLDQAQNKTINFENEGFQLHNNFVKHFQDIDSKDHTHRLGENFKEKGKFRHWYEASR